MQNLSETHPEKGNHNLHETGIHPEVCQPAPEAIREQLEDLLASHRFASSPRCQSLLRYVVEKSLEGNAESLKERNIGIEVFKRDAAYDTNADPVVRVAVSEIRKKLAQYYYEPANQGQVRIELPIGSYIPEFSLPENAPSRDGLPSRPADVLLGTAAAQTATAPSPAFARGSRVRGRIAWMAAVAACLLAICAAAVAWRVAWTKTPLETFWAPVVNARNPVLLCMGQMRATHVQLDPNLSRNPSGAAMPIGANGVYPEELPVAVLDDAITLAKIAGVLRAEKKPFTFSGEGATGYEDLQKGPDVLVGALNNDWTIHLMQPMRFRFNLDAATFEWWISDQKNPGAKLGLVKANSGAKITQDLALVVRAVDTETKQPIIIVAGLTPSGTYAAGEFVTNPQYLNEFLKTAPADWQAKNLEVLLSVNVIDSQPGPPHVVASSVW
jgi:hypothetical protein